MTVSAFPFPDDISYGSNTGPGWEVSVTILDSGHEKRNLPWAQDRATWDVTYGIKTDAQAYVVLEHFHAHRGRLHSFRIRDWGDYQFTDEFLGTGDGVEVDFQLVKRYSLNVNPYTKTIYLPRATTVIIMLDGIPQNEGVDYTLDYNTGIVTFDTPPGNGVEVSGTGIFDKPARYDVKELPTTFDTYNTRSLRIPIVELKRP
jgi:uncharacterized protein (TIGR02217 family)